MSGDTILDEGFDAHTVLLSGYGRLPEGVAGHTANGTVGVVLVVDLRTGQITDVDTTLLTDVARRFVRDLLRGRFVHHEMEDLKNALKARYHGHSQGALMSAVRQLAAQWEKAGFAQAPRAVPDTVVRRTA